MNPKLIVVFTLGGIESHTINADTAEAQAQMQKICDLIQPCLDVADAILRKADLGPTG